MTKSLEQHIVPFHGDEVVAVQQSDSTIYVLFSRLCENLGLARRPQVLRVGRHAILSKGLVTLPVQTEGGPQDVQCLRLDLLPLWLSGLQASRVKEELRPKLVRYQEEAAMVLWQAFKPQIVVAEAALEPAVDDLALQQLQQIAEMGRAITRMAEQQIELQRKQHLLAHRMDNAARVIKDVQTQITGVEVRLGLLEDQLHPTAFVTEAQAAEVSNRVKALGELLTTKHTGKNHYQSIFAELYRRFGVSSYKTIAQEQYAAVLAFLEDWRQAASAASSQQQ
ncbi:MAG: ORF6C domain-containing protein [Chloroflexota bacterium]|nr:ORF6C domain-containing protein [Chloroflexota bacterium]